MILLLNNDTFCEPDFLQHVLAAFDDERVGAVAPLTLQSDGRTIDGVGLTLDATLAPFIRLNGSPREDAAADRPLLVAAGGGADAYLRAAWNEVGGLDERLSFYGADVDLGLRLRASGGAPSLHPRRSRSTLDPRRAGTDRAAHESQVAGREASCFDDGAYSQARVALTVLTEALVVIADGVISRDVSPAIPVSGWKAARWSHTNGSLASAVDRRIGLIESLRLRWNVK